MALVAMPTPVAAHSPLPGIEGFYSGLLHPLTTPEQLLALVATGLLVGGFAPERAGIVVLGLAVGLLAGPALFAPGGEPGPWLLGVAVLAAVLAALAPGRSRVGVAAIAVGTGLLLGWASLPDAGPPADRAFTLAGSVFGAFLWMLYVAVAVAFLRLRITHPAMGIAQRVLASWVGAVAILLLALAISPGTAERAHADPARTMGEMGGLARTMPR